jgi:hypothetical protein
MSRLTLVLSTTLVALAQFIVCRGGDQSMCRSSMTFFRARLSANRCSGRQATEYSAWASSIPISSPFKSSVQRLDFHRRFQVRVIGSRSLRRIPVKTPAPNVN